ncbi:hypothetical protein E3N88_31797 [Mikania micrantha]|uniref:2'-phosphotransferase n=1 Tax=Mikania micrantha TaxID=192012 RepID=A0A5N6M9A7_9ASTR|nr:hypothetical protein E3N88_31797 [Mikania micrantha]
MVVDGSLSPMVVVGPDAGHRSWKTLAIYLRSVKRSFEGCYWEQISEAGLKLWRQSITWKASRKTMSRRLLGQMTLSGERNSAMKESHGRSRGRGGGSSGQDRIDALGRLLTRILRHMASQLNLNMRNDGYVKAQDLLRLNLKTFANVPISSHTIDDIKEAVRRDNKQRFSLLEEHGELLIRANQGHTLTLVETESLLKPILSADEFPVCVHGTYRKNLKSILDSGLKRMRRLHVHFAGGLPTDGEVISGMRRDVNILIFVDIRKALEGGMKFYISDNKVILTEGFDGVVPADYFERIESWPDRKLINF